MTEGQDQGSAAEPAPELSIVLITLNEEYGIGRALESAVRAAQGRRAEIVLVDSASTDNTVKIACSYPVTVLQMDRESEKSPAAGRFVGSQHCTGEFIHFLDGDMMLIDGWMDAAFAAMNDPSLGAVGGQQYRNLPGESLHRDHPMPYPAGPAASLGGAGLYRRSAVEASGGFNPYVKGEEERELGYRLRAKGFGILRLDTPMCFHLNKSRSGAEVAEKSGHFRGVGQILRAYGRADISRDVVRRQKRVILKALVVTAVAVAAMVALLVGSPAVRWLVAVAGLAGGLGLVATKGLRKTLLFFRFNTGVLINIARGYLRGIPAASTYHANVTTIQSRGCIG